MSDSPYRRWLVDSKEKLSGVICELEAMSVKLDLRTPMVLEFRRRREEKTSAQRALWHAIIGDMAEKLGLTPRETKELVKADYWGKHDVQSTERLDKVDYGRLIDFTYQYAAEREIYIPDRRPK